MKNINYVGLTEEAVKKIVSNRQLQSIDFSLSQFLLNLFLGEGSKEAANDLGLIFCGSKNGYVLISPDENYSVQKNTITIDLDSCQLRQVNDSMLITLIQKTLRFCIKYWANMNLNNSEYIPPGSSKAIIFPYPLTNGSSYRITLERQPSERRISKRYPGKHLLAYKFGNNAGDGTKEDYPTTNFSKCIDVLFSHDIYHKDFVDANTSLNPSFLSADLSNDKVDTASILGITDPYAKLSTKQKNFIESNYNEPSRIEGPAGSGKTICMILKMLFWIQKNNDNAEGVKFLFIAPSNEMVNNVNYFINVLSQSIDRYSNINNSKIEVKTLQEICTSFLKQDIHETELLDEDTLESKNVQLLHLAEIVSTRKSAIQQYKSFLSQDFYSFIEREDELHIADMFRHEISVVIKGRSAEDFEKYKDINRPSYGLPITNINDRRFVFDIYSEYTSLLEAISQFDVDDLAISAMSKLDSPIWRRRRRNEGYDAIFIDEVHLFNLNELSLVHHLTKYSTKAPISYAIDLSQALGDIAWNDNDFYSSVGIGNNAEHVILQAVFRSSPAITDLAFSITSHGANIFSNFDNPISNTPYIYGDLLEEDIPAYYLVDSASNVYQKAFEIADERKNNLKLKMHQIALIFFDRSSYHDAIKFASENKKRFIEVTKRGDLTTINQAEKNSLYVLSMSDYVGGLEFEAVILIGVDKGRMPDISKANSTAARMYQSYIAHNRLYVAVTRARKSVSIIGEKLRGESDILENAIANKKINIMNYS